METVQTKTFCDGPHIDWISTNLLPTRPLLTKTIRAESSTVELEPEHRGVWVMILLKRMQL